MKLDGYSWRTRREQRLIYFPLSGREHSLRLGVKVVALLGKKYYAVPEVGIMIVKLYREW